MKGKLRSRVVLGILSGLILVYCPLQAQQPTATGQPSAAQTPTDAQAISQTGLLPVYGVDLRVDPAWVDAAQFPSQSPSFPNFGVNATFQQVWDTLRSGGYNVIRVPIDVRDAGSVNRAANLCAWSKNNYVKLVLLLTGADSGQVLGQDYPAQAANFVKALVTLLRSGDGQALGNYAQIMAYQIEDEMNHAGRHGGMSASAAQQLLLQAAQSFRKTERDALNGTGLDATPLIASASFDFELVKARAIAGGTLTDDAYNQAYQGLKQFLSGITASADIDLIAVDWFAGSISAGGVEKAPALLRNLTPDLPGKQLIFGTGFSTAFRTPQEQQRLYAMAFANLSDYRASAGVDCPFVGPIFREALNGKDANPDPPRPGLPGEMAKWDWAAKGNELAQMWTQKKKSDDMAWWLKKVENNMGLVSLQTDASGNATVSPLPAAQGMSQIADTVSQVNAAQAQAPPADASANLAGPGAAQPGAATDTSGTGASPFAQNLQGKVQQGLLGLLDGVFQRLGSAAGGAGGAGYSGTPGYGYGTPGTPYNYYNDQQPGGQPGMTAGGQPGGQPGMVAPGSIQLLAQDISFQPASIQVGQPVTITVNLRNQGAADAYGLSVLALGEDSVTLARADSLHVAPYSSAPVSLQWSPTDAKSAYRMFVKVGDGYGNEVASVLLDPVAIAAPPSSGSGTATGGGTPTGGGTATPGGTNTSGASGSGGTAGTPTVKLPVGAVKFVGVNLGSASQSLVVGQLTPVVVGFANPYLVPLSNVRATLLVDGKQMQSQSLSVLLPQQNRSLVFPGVSFAQAGRHEVKVMLQSQRPGAQPQSGVVTQQVVVQSTTTAAGGGGTGVRTIGGAPSLARPGSAGGASTVGAPGAVAGSAAGGRPVATTPVRSVVPPSYTVGKITVPTTAAAAAPRTATVSNTAISAPSANIAAPSLAGGGAASAPPPAGGAPRAVVSGPALTGSQAAKGTVDVSVAAQDIRYGPNPPRAGQPLNFSVMVRNLGNLNAQGASIIFRLYADGRLVATSQPLQFNIAGKGTFQANWPTTCPAAQQLQLVAIVAANQDVNPSNSQASITIRMPAPAVQPRTLPPKSTRPY